MEIKFRAWHKLMKEYVTNWNNYGPIMVDGELNSKDHIMEQFISKKDLDEKGIYEGDIVKSQLDDTIRFVDWDEDGAGFKMREVSILINDGMERFSDSLYPEDGSWTVIGNIHENPELIK